MPASVLPIVLGVLVLALLGAVLLRMLTNEIGIGGLAAGRTGGDLEPERVPALASAVVLPVAYLAIAVAEGGGGGTAAAMPEAPLWMLAVAAFSQILFVAGKIGRR